MTNAEINLEIAVKALSEGKLKGSAANFIDEIKDFDKKDLKGLSPKQYRFLADVAKQNS